MFPEYRLLHEELNAFNRIVVKQLYAIIVAKVVWISQTVVTQYAGYPTVDAHCIQHWIQHFQ